MRITNIIITVLTVFAFAASPAFGGLGDEAGQPLTLKVDAEQGYSKLVIHGAAAEQLFNFLADTQMVEKEVGDMTWTFHIGFGMSCARGATDPMAQSAQKTVYYCEQKMIPDGDTFPGGVDPIIGVGNQ